MHHDRAHNPNPPSRFRQWAIRLVFALIGLLIAGELSARFIVGLGDPPLFILDPEIEYLLAPNQQCRRFGHDYIVNEASMRSPRLATPKPASEQRVLVIGDSIVNGGGKVDQSKLATTLISEKIAKQSGPWDHRSACNISAPSWGPPNQLAFIKKFGTFDADIVVLVLNSDDYDDVPGLEYIGSSWPRTKPWCALQELVGVYGWKAACRAIGRAPEPSPPARTATHDQDIEMCRKAFTELVELARAKGARVAVVQYLKQLELSGNPQTGYAAIGEWSRALGIEPVSTGPVFKAAADTGKISYLDGVHANDLGQEQLAETLRQAIESASTSPPAGK